jgi:hypothetical protein
MEREKFVHKKYPVYKSLLVPLLSWDEIQEHIIDKYDKPKKYTETVEESEIDNLVKKHTDKYESVELKDLINTLKYLFENYKEFLFFSIRDNKINAKFHIYNRELVNTWHKKLSVSEGKNFNDFFNIVKKKVNGLKLDLLPPNKWYANNCIIRMENWGDMGGMPNSYLNEFLEIFEYCMDKYKLPDCDFIMNRKDFALLTTDKSNSYFSLYQNNEQNTQPNKCWFVCSQSGRKQTLDTIVPTSDEWKFISNKDNMHVNQIWNSKKNIIIWRGSTTGCGVNANNNPRIKMAVISNELKNEGNKHIDVGIAKFTKGFRITNGVIHYINRKDIRIPQANHITYDEQTNYKYMLNIEGNTAAYRFSSLFYSNSLVININSKFKLWFQPLLEKNKNYISIKKDFDKSKIKKILNFVIENDDTSKYIADNGKLFFDKYINKDTIAEYWFKIMIEFNKKQL